MRVGIIGIGALGSLFAAYLSAHAEIVMLGHWPPQLRALQEQGLWLEHPDGRQSQHQVQATDRPETIAPADIVLVLVKSYQTERAAAQARILLGEHGFALTLQNGLGNLETLTASLGQERVVLGTTSEGATLVEPGRVRHAGTGQTYLARHNALAVAQLASLFKAAGFATDLSDDVQSLVWGKLAVNAAINPLSALLRVENGRLLAQEESRFLMELAATEVATLAEVQQIRLPYTSAAEQAVTVARQTATNHSSMLQDMLNGRQTEIEAISGAVVRLGQQLEVPTPVNAAMWKLVSVAQQGEPWQQEISALPLDVRPLFHGLKG